jgi:hypothetical protein
MDQAGDSIRGVTRLSEEELARSAGTTVEEIRRLVQLHILRPQNGTFDDRDISRVRVVEALDREGISSEVLARAIERGQISFDWVTCFMPAPIALTGKTYAETTEELGFGRETVDRLYTLWGLAAPPPDGLVREDDEAILRVGVEVFNTVGRDEAVFAAAILRREPPTHRRVTGRVLQGVDPRTGLHLRRRVPGRDRSSQCRGPGAPTRGG